MTVRAPGQIRRNYSLQWFGICWLGHAQGAGTVKSDLLFGLHNVSIVVSIVRYYLTSLQHKHNTSDLLLYTASPTLTQQITERETDWHCPAFVGLQLCCSIILYIQEGRGPKQIFLDVWASHISLEGFVCLSYLPIYCLSVPIFVKTFTFISMYWSSRPAAMGYWFHHVTKYSNPAAMECSFRHQYLS